VADADRHRPSAGRDRSARPHRRAARGGGLLHRALAEGRDYEWVEPFREAVRQQAIDAHLALAAALGEDDPAKAAAVLRAAIGHDPHNEPLYQQAMHLSARLGDVEGIRDLRRTLTRAMGAIDTEPGEDTLTLADRLVTDLQHRPRQPRPLRGDAA
jgi:DNA-binding SARP family transcriptional activator